MRGRKLVRPFESSYLFRIIVGSTNHFVNRCLSHLALRAESRPDSAVEIDGGIYQAQAESDRDSEQTLGPQLIPRHRSQPAP